MNILNRIIESFMCIILHHSIISKIILFIIFLITTSVILGLSIHFIPLTSILSLFFTSALIAQAIPSRFFYQWGAIHILNWISSFHILSFIVFLLIDLSLYYYLTMLSLWTYCLLIDQHSIPLPYSMIGLYVVVLSKFSL